MPVTEPRVSCAVLLCPMCTEGTPAGFVPLTPWPRSNLSPAKAAGGGSSCAAGPAPAALTGIVPTTVCPCGRGGCWEREGRACCLPADRNSGGSFGSTTGSGVKFWSTAPASKGQGTDVPNSKERLWACEEAAWSASQRVGRRDPLRLQVPVCNTTPPVA